MLRAVIWDFDGTICDTYPAIAGAINAALASFSVATYAIDPSDALVIGDRDVDMLAGQAVGASTCLFRATFPDLTPTRTIWNYAELADIVPATSIGKPETIFEVGGS